MIMEAKFSESRTKSTNQKNTTMIFAASKYEEILKSVLANEVNPKKQTPKEKNWYRRFTVRIENGENKLFRDDKKVVKEEELFELLQRTHIKLGHGGRDIMWKELQPTFSGISKEIIMEFINHCEACTLKQAKAKKSLVIKPILSEDFNSRCQVDLVDLQTRPDENYRFLMVYQDHLTKYSVLNPLERKTAAEVAKHLVKIFSDFGAPRILQSDNGKEFANQVVREVCRLWPETRIVHGKPRHSQSQGSVERANRDIMDILTIEMRERKTTQWARLLPFVQVKKNRRFHRGIQRTPYQAMFGGKSMQLGNEDRQMPTNEERGIFEEEDDELEEFVIIDGNDWITDVDDRYVQLDHEEEDATEESALELELNQRDQDISEHRAGARKSQNAQAQKMLAESAKRFAPIEIGTNVRIRVEDVDRSKVDPRNALGVILSVEDGFYKIGTESGTLKQMYSRNQFEPCSSDFISAENVPPTEISLREAVGAASMGGTQGHKHCNCTTKCGTKRCTCVLAGVRCNSRCHHSNTCHNKFDEG